MLEGVDQYEATIQADGSIVVPATLMEKMRWRPGLRVSLEQTDDGVLVIEMEAPGDVEPV